MVLVKPLRGCDLWSLGALVLRHSGGYGSGNFQRLYGTLRPPRTREEIWCTWYLPGEKEEEYYERKMQNLPTPRRLKVCSEIPQARVPHRSGQGQTLAPGGEKLLHMWARLALTRNYTTPMVLTCMAKVLDGQGGWLHAMSQRREKQRSLKRTQDAERVNYLGLEEQPSSKEIYHRCQEVYEKLWAKAFTRAYFLRFRRLDSSNLNSLGHLPGLIKRQQSMDFHLQVLLPGGKYLGAMEIGKHSGSFSPRRTTIKYFSRAA